MLRLSRLVLTPACLVLYSARWFELDGAWSGVLAFLLGVSAVVIELRERRRRRADELSTLDLHR